MCVITEQFAVVTIIKAQRHNTQNIVYKKEAMKKSNSQIYLSVLIICISKCDLLVTVLLEFVYFLIDVPFKCHVYCYRFNTSITLKEFLEWNFKQNRLIKQGFLVDPFSTHTNIYACERLRYLPLSFLA